MTTKPYNTDETSQSQPVSEPAVSYGLPQDTASLKLAAINELKQELAEAEDDFANGRVYSTDELRKEMHTW
ncbi:hypothetical protein [uncultured Parabacteroides sp.]|jgi:hypothetical protein|uniref:hypothetical protein n=1 Tax=uncultured Parabacteroides sp. TaxID=512312 RepID=UPI0025FFED64|nr:hypothetical protein [uncultured Parabacteroides sp.]